MIIATYQLPIISRREMRIVMEGGERVGSLGGEAH